MANKAELRAKIERTEADLANVCDLAYRRLETIQSLEVDVEMARSVIAAVEALRDEWDASLQADQCPSCWAILTEASTCDHEEGYHHALSNLRAALSAPAPPPGEGDHRPGCASTVPMPFASCCQYPAQPEGRDQ